ncbi:MAG: RIP metalloprotease RseP [Candidatus Kerfeldbacteria bacterium]|nr:RIP metalloprotease RseP [Candidatus Kerfeldbacteria bacterium]
MLVTILVFIGVLLVLVLAHELGHFLAARSLGVTVEEFAFGFPPRLWGTKRGQTTYSINWLPLGGFVKLKGEQVIQRHEPDSFSAQPPWRRAVILVAGVTMNVILCFVLITGGLMVGLPTMLDASQLTQARDVKIQIVNVLPGAPADKAGLKLGDEVKELDGRRFTVLSEMQNYIAAQGGKTMDITLLRGKEVVKTSGVPQVLSESAGRAALGVNLVQTGIIAYPWYESIWRGGVATYNLAIDIGRGFGQLFKNLIINRQVPKDVAGPVGIAVMTGQVAELGWIYVLQFAALLSLNLAFINLFPFPALDGGRLLFVIIEKLRGKPNNEKVEGLVHNVGFAILMLLVVLITYQDLLHFGGGFVKAVTNFLGV